MLADMKQPADRTPFNILIQNEENTEPAIDPKGPNASQSGFPLDLKCIFVRAVNEMPNRGIGRGL